MSNIEAEAAGYATVLAYIIGTTGQVSISKAKMKEILELNLGLNFEDDGDNFIITVREKE